MKSIIWWETAVIAVLGIAVIGVMQLKANNATTRQPEQQTVATAPEAAAAPEAAGDQQPEKTETATTTQQPAPPAKDKSTTTPGTPVKSATSPATPPAPAKAKAVKQATFIELGADQCIPCKMMQPIMDELRQEYPDTLKVVFYDVWKDATPAEKYGIRAIPTQVLLDGDGKEIFRHVGFWPKDEIVAKFKELGIEL